MNQIAKVGDTLVMENIEDSSDIIHLKLGVENKEFYTYNENTGRVATSGYRYNLEVGMCTFGFGIEKYRIIKILQKLKNVE